MIIWMSADYKEMIKQERDDLDLESENLWSFFDAALEQICAATMTPFLQRCRSIS
jgi:hypothetical protein